MKKLTAIITILILILSSCDSNKGKGIKFEIRNNSDQEIAKVKFYTSEKLTIAEFDKIEPNESVSDFLTMKSNRSDGNYVLEFTRADEKKEIISCGYYTNGGSLNNKVKFEIKKDTTLSTFRGNGY
jgi:hypothetical protein